MSTDKPKIVVGTIGSDHSALRSSLAASIAIASVLALDKFRPDEPITEVGDVWLCNFTSMRLTVKATDEYGIIASQNVYYSHGNNDMLVTYDRLLSGYTKEQTK